VNSKFSAIILSSVSLGALSIAGAAAQTAPAAPQVAAAAPQVAATPQTAAAPLDVESITVFGQGQTRQIDQITTKDIERSAPGTSPIKVIASLPGVNYESADPFGAYEWATRISVRGFNQNQLGFTLDDVPLGDMTYGNWNGLHISRAISDENLGVSELSQGTGALGTASNSNLGGTLQFHSIDPSDSFQTTVAETVGSDSTFREFARLESGLLNTGTKFYISLVNMDSNKWKGVGDQHYWQENAKLVQSLGSVGTFTGWLNYSDRAEVDYQDLSKNYVQKLGYNWDNYYPDWQAAIKAAEGVYTRGENTTADPLDAAYYAGSGQRKDIIGGGTFDINLTSDLKWKTTVYGHSDDGVGEWFTPYTPTPGPNGTIASPISVRTSEYQIQREGGLSSLTWSTGANTVSTGMWYEHNDFDQERRFYATSLNAPLVSPYSFPTDPFATQWAYQFIANTVQGFVDDTYKINDQLTLEAGFKGTSTSIDGTLTSGSGLPQGSVTASSPFLPQIGVNWRVTEDDEIFADVAKNMRTYTAGGPGFGASPFDTADQASFNSSLADLKPETSWSYEVGYRFKHGDVSGESSVYHIDFSNRLLAAQPCPAIVGCAAILENVGGVTTNGVQIAETWHITPEWTWYNGGSWNYSAYDNNLVTGGVTIHTAGKLAVDTPQFLYKTDIGYHKGGLFTDIDGDYMSTRYYTYVNDGSVPGRFLWNFKLGYMWDQASIFHDLKAQVNVYNILDKKYYASIGTNGFTNSDPNGTFQTLQVGSPREYFFTLTTSF
jgi:iron complex outermembrane recepter protein